MKIKDKYPLSYLVKYHGFVEGFKSSSTTQVSVSSKHRSVDVGAHRHWISSDDYYHHDADILVKLIKKGIVVEG